MLVKRSNTQLLLIVLATLSLVFPSSSFSNQKDQWQDQQAQQQQLDELRQNILKVKKWIEGAQNEQSNLVKELRSAELQINQTVRKINELENDIHHIQSQLGVLKKKEAKLLETLQQQQIFLAQQVRAAYAMGREQGVKLLLNAEDLLTLQRLMNYYSYLNSARGEQIAKSRQIIAGLQQTRTEILSKNQILISSRSKLANNKDALETSFSQRKLALVNLNKNLSGKQSQLQQMKLDHQQLERLVKEVTQSINSLELSNDEVPFDKLQGKLIWPTNGSIARRFGSGSNNQFRSPGVFFKAKINEPVSAVHHGRVVFANWLRGFGLLLIIDHGDDYMSLYGFNQALLKDTGDWVTTGEIIASTGNSGGQTESGLYFEIRHKGKPSNPVRWLQKKHTKK
jgi:murein hydrolase activator